MKLRKILLFLGLILAPISGGSIYYLYHIQTKAITILQIKANLGHAVEPGMRITSDLLEQKVVLQKDVPLDSMLPGSVGNNVYASKYLYPSDPLLSAKVSNQTISFKNANQRIISVKPTEMGMMGLIQLDDIITIVTPTLSLPNIRVVGITDAAGSVISIIPQFTRAGNDGGYLQSIANTTQAQVKSAAYLLVLVSKENADILSKLSKDSITVVFEGRPSLPDAK